MLTRVWNLVLKKQSSNSIEFHENLFFFYHSDIQISDQISISRLEQGWRTEIYLSEFRSDSGDKWKIQIRNRIMQCLPPICPVAIPIDSVVAMELRFRVSVDLGFRIEWTRVP